MYICENAYIVIVIAHVRIQRKTPAAAPCLLPHTPLSHCVRLCRVFPPHLWSWADSLDAFSMGASSCTNFFLASLLS